MASGLGYLASYVSSSDGEEAAAGDTFTTSSTAPSEPRRATASTVALINVAPSIPPPRISQREDARIAPNTTELSYNPRADELYAPQFGPLVPSSGNVGARGGDIVGRNGRREGGGGAVVRKNMLSGHVETANGVNAYQFEDQRRTFNALGYAHDPSVVPGVVPKRVVGNAKRAAVHGNNALSTLPRSSLLTRAAAPPATAATGSAAAIDRKSTDDGAAIRRRQRQQRKRKKAGNAEDIESWRGPWAGYEDEKASAAPTEEQMSTMESWKTDEDRAREAAKRARAEGGGVGSGGTGTGASGAAAEKDGEGEEGDGDTGARPGDTKTTLHIEDAIDYQGRSFLHPPPAPEGTHYGEPPEHCFLPRRICHTWSGHSKGVAAIRFFPRTAHLLLSAGLDGRVILWETQGRRRRVRTYMGHTAAVKDIDFNRDGTRFVSCSYDKTIRLWDTETGECLRKFVQKAAINCIRFHPAPETAHVFVAGTAKRKALALDSETGELVQEYDRHTGSINSVTFTEEGTRMVTTSDDKSVRVWEWDIPVDVKYIADPTLQSMPRVAVHPRGKWMVLQSMDNKMLMFGAKGRYSQAVGKYFSGHNSAGYACQPAFSPDGRYVLTGDGDGRLCVWDWKSRKRYAHLKAHEKCCIDVAWNPTDPRHIATAGWDGKIHYWE